MALRTVTIAGTVKAFDGTPFDDEDGKSSQARVTFETLGDMVDADGNVLYPQTSRKCRLVGGEIKAEDGTSPFVIVASDYAAGFSMPYLIIERWSGGKTIGPINLSTDLVVGGVIPFSSLVTPDVPPDPVARVVYQLVVVDANGDATTARPDGALAVYWVNSPTPPVNAEDNDLWFAPT